MLDTETFSSPGGKPSALPSGSPVRYRCMLQVVAIVAAIVISEGRVDAQTQAHVVVDGKCPTAEQLSSALRSEGIVPAARASAAWLVRVAPIKGRARLELRKPSGLVLLERRVSSVDCQAIADAFALMIAARLRAEAEGRADAAEDASAKAAAGASVAGNGGGDAAGARGQRGKAKVALAVAPRRFVEQTVIRVPLQPPGLEARTLARPEKRQRWAVGLLAGLDTGVDPQLRTTFTQLDASLLRPERWGARVALSRDATAHGGMIHRSQISAAVLLLRTWTHGQMWLSPGAGASLVISTVTARDDVIKRIHPALNGGVTWGLKVARNVSLRADVGAQLFPIVDDYVSNQMGYLGNSPRALISFGLGFQVDTRGW